MSGPRSRKSELYEKSAEAESKRRDSVAAGGADPFDEPLCPELGQIVAKLRPAVLVIGELIALE
jgi:hypothetical protein